MAGAGGRHLIAVSAASVPPRKARPIRFAPHISGASAFRHIVGACLVHYSDNRPAALAGIDDEGIHQARVALRRLRSALVLFEDYAGAAQSLAFQDGLRDMARILGDARDWDVFAGETLPAYLAAEPKAPIGAIRAAAVRARAGAHRQVRRLLTDADHDRLIAEIGDWAEGDRWRSGLGLHAFRGLDEPFRSLAGPLLDRAARRAAKRGRGLADHAPEERHALRKAMKKLRYSAEFLSSLYRDKDVRRYLKSVERLQDVLGGLNDAAATVALIDRLAADAGRDRIAFGRLRDWATGSCNRDLHDLERVWKNFATVAPFWR